MWCASSQDLGCFRPKSEPKKVSVRTREQTRHLERLDIHGDPLPRCWVPGTYQANSCRKSHGSGQPLRSTAKVTRQRQAKASGCASSTKPRTSRRSDNPQLCQHVSTQTVAKTSDLGLTSLVGARIFFWNMDPHPDPWIGPSKSELLPR